MLYIKATLMILVVKLDVLGFGSLLKIPDKIRFSKIGKKLLLRKTFESKLLSLRFLSNSVLASSGLVLERLNSLSFRLSNLIAK